MGFKAAVQILKQIDDLKAKVLKKTDLLIDSEAWTDQQKLQTVCQQALLSDLEYALDKKVEQDLWNIGFKNHIAILQELIRDKKNSRRSECQALLTWCLEAASGFYLTLLHELCDAFDVDLPFRRRGNIYGQTNTLSEFNVPQTSSCLYICQYCLVHLGDIARYRNQRKQAETFYRQAILVSPNSGHPYNQLALLQASQGDKLSTVFYYIRSITVKNPFPASTTNLLNTLTSTIDKDSPLEKNHRKITISEFIQIFLSTHAYLHTATDLNQAEIGVHILNSTMTALVATQSFTADKLIKITAINLYALRHLNGETLTEDEKVVKQYILDLLAGSLSAFLVPVHTLKNDETILDYYALPAIKLLTYWIQNEPEVLNNVVFANRLQIWPSLCKLLNNVQSYLCELNNDEKKYLNYPLFEDRNLQGYRPFAKNFKDFNFKLPNMENDRTEKRIRLKRITDFGRFITNIDVNNTKLIVRNVSEGVEIFEPGCIQPDPTNDLLEEMKSINIMDSLQTTIKKNTEKRVGILKPQGSLEKSREERELLTSSESNLSTDVENSSNVASFAKKEIVKQKRSKQNVALQSIFKKLEENKQVKFNVDDSNNQKEKERMMVFDTKPITNQFNTQLRPQNFTQNHPPPFQPDYTMRNINNKPPINPQQQNYPLNSLGNLKNQPPPLQQMGHYSNFSNNKPNTVVGNNINTFNSGVHGRGLNSYIPPPPPPQHTQTHSYLNNDNNKQSGSWWPTQQQTFQQRPDNNFQMNNYSYNMPYNMGNNPPPPPPLNEFNNKNNSGNSNQAGGDMFNSPWSNFGRNFMNDTATNVGFEGGGSSSSTSMRQIGLEGGNLGMHPAARTVSNPESFLPNPQNSQGYTLFNTNTWSPNLVGQLRNNKPQENPISHLPQQSLFGGSGPKSLAQLLEQQQLQKTDQ